jgi:2-hydroxyglutarate dehydrogenase
MSEERFDVVIVGAGIVGLAVAREMLRRSPGLRLAVVEREREVAGHQTGHNSGVIHSGIYYKPGSLKARLCVEGARRMYEYCDEHGIPVKRCGKVIVALDEHELGPLDEIEARGRANGVTGLRRLSAAALREVEPHASGIDALHAPDTGVVDFGVVARSIAGELAGLGAVVRHGVTVERLRRSGDMVVVEHDGGELLAKQVICCAGGWADPLADSSGAPADVRIVPFRGQYLRLKDEARGLVNGLIYPVPDPALPFLGVHLTRQVHDEVLVGPSALMVAAPDAYRLIKVDARSLARTFSWPGTYRMGRRWWRTGLEEAVMAARRAVMVRAAARYVPALTVADTVMGPAGVRAQAVGRDGALVDDFLVSGSDGMLHVRNAPSPAATSAFALAELIVDRAEGRPG